MQVLLTQLVFDHSLRIRLKAEKSSGKAVSDSPTSSAVSVAEGRASEQPATAAGSVSGDDAPSDNGNEHTERDEDAGSKSSVKGKAKAEAKEEINKPTSDTGNLLGRINNLVTSDISIIADSNDFLSFGIYVFRIHSLVILNCPSSALRSFRSVFVPDFSGESAWMEVCFNLKCFCASFS